MSAPAFRATSVAPVNRRPVTSRSELLGLLSEACELEHGLACSYLYTAFTLKTEEAEGGVTWDQVQLTRRWAAQIFYVASQEMLHLSQAWNLLAAIGGMPYYLRPNFPQSSKYFPLHLPLKLEPFSESALHRFVYYERPSEIPHEEALTSLGFHAAAKEVAAAEPSFRSVGELYALIASGFKTIPEDALFLVHDGQADAALVDFPKLVPVHDRSSALAAIGMITEQGEGTEKDREDCHFGVFKAILAALKTETERARRGGSAFVPARPSAQDPATRIRPDTSGGLVHLITHPETKAVAETFDDLYGLMLRMLVWAFASPGSPPTARRQLARAAIGLMTTVLRPLGGALTKLPLDASSASITAGPTFGLSRHVNLPVAAEHARALALERLRELDQLLSGLASRASGPVELTGAARSLHALLTGF